MQTASHPAQVNIRPAQTADAAALAALATELGYPASPADMHERICELHALDDHAVLVAEAAEAGGIVGWAHVCRMRELESDPFAEICGLVVTAAARSAGIGAALVSACEDWARRRGLARVRVRSRVERERAHRFYERLDYRRVKSQAVFDKALRSEGSEDGLGPGVRG